VAVTVVILLGIVSNVDKLRDGGGISRQKSEITKGELSAFRIAGENVIGGYKPTALETSAGLDLAAMAHFGSPALAPSELARASGLARQSADRALAGSLGIKLESSSHKPGRSGTAPEVVQVFAARTGHRGGCVSISPPREGGATPSGGRLAELALPQSGVEVAARDLSRVQLLLGKFAPPSIVLPPVSGHDGVLRTPADQSTEPWKLTIASDQSVSVCGLAGG
jgi:hypothetical protein